MFSVFDQYIKCLHSLQKLKGSCLCIPPSFSSSLLFLCCFYLINLLPSSLFNADSFPPPLGFHQFFSPFCCPLTNCLSFYFSFFLPPCSYPFFLLINTLICLIPSISFSVSLSFPPTDGSPGSSEDPLQLHVRLSVSAGPDGLSSK